MIWHIFLLFSKHVRDDNVNDYAGFHDIFVKICSKIDYIGTLINFAL